eukprot:scaffold345060_cov35-Attheya_sp.AAC.2
MSNNVSLFISIPGYCGPGYINPERSQSKSPTISRARVFLEEGLSWTWEVAGVGFITPCMRRALLMISTILWLKSLARVTPMALTPRLHTVVTEHYHWNYNHKNVPLLKWYAAAKRLKEWKFWHGTIPFGSGLPQTL